MGLAMQELSYPFQRQTCGLPLLDAEQLLNVARCVFGPSIDSIRAINNPELDVVANLAGGYIDCRAKLIERESGLCVHVSNSDI